MTFGDLGLFSTLSAITFYVFQWVTRICHTPCHITSLLIAFLQKFQLRITIFAFVLAPIYFLKQQLKISLLTFERLLFFHMR